MRTIYPSARFTVPQQDHEKASFWLSTLSEAIHPRPALAGDLDCDIAVAGAGFTGLWTAYFLKQMRPALNIVMLDAHVAGYGASGRNGGWCTAELLHLEDWLEDPAAHRAACGLQRAMFETVRKIGDIAAREGLDCHYARAGTVTISRNPAQHRRLAQFARKMEGAGFGDDFVLLDRAQARAHIHIEDTSGGLFSPHCAAIHPARLARGLARHLEMRGVRIFEGSPVRALSGRRFDTDAGSLSAQTCVLACEGYTPSIEGFEHALAPLHSRMIVTAPLSDAQWRASGLNARLCFGDARRFVGYGQVTADRRIAFGARGDYHFGSAIEDRIDLDDPRIAFVRARLQGLLPQLADVPVEMAWTGPLGLPRARAPFAFFDAARGFAWAGGYLGAGVAASCLAGELLAAQILGADAPYKDDIALIQALPRNFEREPLRWIGIELYRKWLGLLDSLGL